MPQDVNQDPDVGTRVWSDLVSAYTLMLDNRPLSWRTASGQRPTDEWLFTQGYLGFVDPGPPAYDPSYQVVRRGSNAVNPDGKTASPVYSIERLSDDELRWLVTVERQRRMSVGFDYDFGDARGVHRIGTTEQDMRGWEEVTALASALIATGSSSTQLAIVTDTGPVSVTAAEWQSVLLAAASFRQPIWAASFALQAMSPVPDDYTDNRYWDAA